MNSNSTELLEEKSDEETATPVNVAENTADKKKKKKKKKKATVPMNAEQLAFLACFENDPPNIAEAQLIYIQQGFTANNEFMLRALYLLIVCLKDKVIIRKTIQALDLLHLLLCNDEVQWPTVLGAEHYGNYVDKYGLNPEYKNLLQLAIDASIPSRTVAELIQKGAPIHCKTNSDMTKNTLGLAVFGDYFTPRKKAQTLEIIDCILAENRRLKTEGGKTLENRDIREAIENALQLGYADYIARILKRAPYFDANILVEDLSSSVGPFFLREASMRNNDNLEEMRTVFAEDILINVSQSYQAIIAYCKDIKSLNKLSDRLKSYVNELSKKTVPQDGYVHNLFQDNENLFRLVRNDVLSKGKAKRFFIQFQEVVANRIYQIEHNITPGSAEDSGMDANASTSTATTSTATVVVPEVIPIRPMNPNHKAFYACLSYPYEEADIIRAKTIFAEEKFPIDSEFILHVLHILIKAYAICKSEVKQEIKLFFDMVLACNAESIDWHAILINTDLYQHCVETQEMNAEYSRVVLTDTTQDLLQVAAMFNSDAMALDLINKGACICHRGAEVQQEATTKNTLTFAFEGDYDHPMQRERSCTILQALLAQNNKLIAQGSSEILTPKDIQDAVASAVRLAYPDYIRAILETASPLSFNADAWVDILEENIIGFFRDKAYLCYLNITTSYDEDDIEPEDEFKNIFKSTELKNIYAVYDIVIGACKNSDHLKRLVQSLSGYINELAQLQQRSSSHNADDYEFISKFTQDYRGEDDEHYEDIFNLLSTNSGFRQEVMKFFKQLRDKAQARIKALKNEKQEANKIPITIECSSSAVAPAQILESAQTSTTTTMPVTAVVFATQDKIAKYSDDDEEQDSEAQAILQLLADLKKPTIPPVRVEPRTFKREKPSTTVAAQDSRKLQETVSQTPTTSVKPHSQSSKNRRDHGRGRNRRNAQERQGAFSASTLAPTPMSAAILTPQAPFKMVQEEFPLLPSQVEKNNVAGGTAANILATPPSDEQLEFVVASNPMKVQNSTASSVLSSFVSSSTRMENMECLDEQSVLPGGQSSVISRPLSPASSIFSPAESRSSTVSPVSGISDTTASQTTAISVLNQASSGQSSHRDSMTSLSNSDGQGTQGAVVHHHPRMPGLNPLFIPTVITDGPVPVATRFVPRIVFVPETVFVNGISEKPVDQVGPDDRVIRYGRGILDPNR